MTVGSGNVDTGEYETFTQDNVAFEDFHLAAMASSSIPGVFPPQHFKDMVLMDGGTIWDVNLNSAIHQCNDMGVTDPAKIIIDIAICGPGKDGSFEPTRNAAETYLNSYMLHKAYAGMNAIQW